MRQPPARHVGGGGDQFGQGLRRGDLHQPVAAALLRGLDHRATESVERVRQIEVAALKKMRKSLEAMA
jgi:hypothetical protein